MRHRAQAGVSRGRGGALVASVVLVFTQASVEGVAVGEWVDARLERVDKDLEKRNWSNALKKIEALVADAEHRSDIEARATRVLAAWREARYWRDRKPIPIHKLIYGEPSLAASNGKLTLEYDTKGKDDELHELLGMDQDGAIELPSGGWLSTGHLPVFLRPDPNHPGAALTSIPLEFVDSFDFDVVGTAVPAENHDDRPRIEFGPSAGLTYRINSRWAIAPGSVERCEEGQCAVIEKRLKRAWFKARKPQQYRAALEVSRDRFGLGLNKHGLMSLPKERVFGRVGFSRFTLISKLRAEGTVSDAWVKSLYDAWRVRDLELSGRDPLCGQPVPDWLLDAAGADALDEGCGDASVR